MQNSRCTAGDISAGAGQVSCIEADMQQQMVVAHIRGKNAQRVIANDGGIDLCALELGQKTYKTTKIKHYYQCIAWEQVEPIPNQH